MTRKNKQNIEVSTAFIRNSAIDIPESTYLTPVGSSPLTYAKKTRKRFNGTTFFVVLICFNEVNSAGTGQVPDEDGERCIFLRNR